MRFFNLRRFYKPFEPLAVIAHGICLIQRRTFTETDKIGSGNFIIFGQEFYLIVKAFLTRQIAVQKQNVFARSRSENGNIFAVYKNL